METVFRIISTDVETSCNGLNSNDDSQPVGFDW